MSETQQTLVSVEGFTGLIVKATLLQTQFLVPGKEDWYLADTRMQCHLTVEFNNGGLQEVKAKMGSWGKPIPGTFTLKEADNADA